MRFRALPLWGFQLATLSGLLLTGCKSDDGEGDRGDDTLVPETGDGDVGLDTPQDAQDAADLGEEVTPDLPAEFSDEPDLADEPDIEYDLFHDDPCPTPVPTEAALLPAGAVEDGRVLSPGGRGLGAPGTHVQLEGYASNIAVSADGTRAWVLTSSTDDRRVFTVDVVSGTVLQNLELDDAFYGIAFDDARDRVYVSGGRTLSLEVFDVSPDDGTLAHATSVALGTYTSGIAITPDGSRVFVGSFSQNRLFELDADLIGAGDPIVREFAATQNIWDVQYIAASDQIVTSALNGTTVEFVSHAAGTVGPKVEVGSSPMGMAISADDSRLWVAVSRSNALVELDIASHAVTVSAPVAAEAPFSEGGEVLDRSNPNDVALSPDGTRLYVTRGSDDAITVYDAGTLELLGSIPTGWYPTGAALTPDGSTLLVTEGRGFGTGPSNGRSSADLLDGSISVVPLSELDLTETTERARANFNRATEVFPFECDGFFPVPVRFGDPSPIRHVILVVKENKTFDCVFGDLEGMDVDVDPTLVRWGEELTPNQHALAREFNISDNFYDEVEDSDQGHITLTSGMMTDYVERVWAEADRNEAFVGFQVLEPATPEDGNIFTHMMDNGMSLRVYGEIVGLFETAADGQKPVRFADSNYPGGIFFNMGVRDTERAEYVLERIALGDFARFTFMLLPNDHTGGSAPGNPTPESEVADNDYALGLLIDGLSHSDAWESTAVFVVEDDPQGCRDHVDSHRAFVMVFSPWARRGYVSHVNYNFQSVFATIERILGVPPMGRHDAAASPMWDFFSATPDYTPYNVRANRTGEMRIDDTNVPGAEESMRMDFRGPDRNPRLGVVLDNYRLWRMGRLTREEAQARIDAGIVSLPAGVDPEEYAEELEEIEEELEEEEEEERYAFDHAWEQYVEWLREQGQPAPELPGAPLDDDTIRRVMSRQLPIDAVRRFAR